MALIELNKTTGGTSLGIWKITEPTETLLGKVSELGISIFPAGEFHADLRKAQWAGVRLLLKELLDNALVEIVYDPYGKPHLKDGSAHISISHSRQMVAVIIDPRQATGIDIEIISPKVRAIKKKFLSEVELDFVDPVYEIEHLLALWGAKEALYKTYGKKKLIFREQIMIHPFSYQETGKITGVIHTLHFQQEFQLKYEKKENYMLVYLLNN